MRPASDDVRSAAPVLTANSLRTRGERGRVRDEPVSAAFERLSERIRSCTLCPLSRERTQAVVYRGSLAPNVVFVGEAPGAEEDRRGVPFVGRSGQLLDRSIATIGAALGPFGVLNVLKCQPPRNRFDPAAARTCRPYLDRQLALLRPHVVVPLGTHAWKTFVADGPPILQAAGSPRRGPGVWLFPLIHPAAALRSRRWRARWDADLAALGAWLASPGFETI